MYIEDPAKVYGCYHCGEIMGDYSLADTGHFVCSCCGEPSIITLQTALDTLIKLQLEGHILQSDYYDEDTPDAEVALYDADWTEDEDYND